MPTKPNYRNATRHSSNAAQGIANGVYSAAEQGFNHWLKWTTADHLGTSRRLASMPKLGVIDSIRFMLITAIGGIVGALVSGAIVFLVIAYGIPLLFFGHL